MASTTGDVMALPRHTMAVIAQISSRILYRIDEKTIFKGKGEKHVEKRQEAVDFSDIDNIIYGILDKKKDNPKSHHE